MTLCACGCGGEVNSGRFLQRHGRKGHTHTQQSKDAISDAHTKPLVAPQLCECGCGEYANPGRHFIKGHGMAGKTDKNSNIYLGVRVAEHVLSMVFKNVQVMPPQNPGYDVICNKDFKIDIKSCATGDKRGRWEFHINKNTIADYFLCLAFNSRSDLYNPVHLWLIPGHIINHLVGLAISKNAIDKWCKYELPIDKVIICCNEIY